MRSYISAESLLADELYAKKLRSPENILGVHSPTRGTGEVIKLLLHRYGSRFDISKLHVGRENYSAQYAISDITSMLIGYDVCTLNSGRKTSDELNLPEGVDPEDLEEFLSNYNPVVPVPPKTTWYVSEDVVSA